MFYLLTARQRAVFGRSDTRPSELGSGVLEQLQLIFSSGSSAHRKKNISQTG